MKNPLYTALAAFGAGFLIAWVIKPHPEAQDLDVTAAQPRLHPREHRLGPGRRHAASDPETQRLLKQIMEERHFSHLALADIKPEQYAGLLRGIASEAGLTGLDYEQESILERLLFAWYQEDPVAAENWVVSLSSMKDQAELLSDLIDELSTKDWDAAVDLAKRRGTHEGRELKMGYQAMDELSKLPPEEFVAFASLFLAQDGSGGSTINYPSDFDFKTTLDQLDAARRELPSGYDFSSMPTNLLSEWARRDFEAAWEWSKQDKHVPFNDQSSLLNGLAPMLSQQEISSISSRLVTDGTDRQQGFRSAWHVLADHGGPETMQLFLNELEGPRQDNINSLFATSLRGHGGNFDSFKQMMVEQMTPQERMAAFQHVQSGSTYGGTIQRDQFEPILRRLGHSQAEIDQMFPPAR